MEASLSQVGKVFKTVSRQIRDQAQEMMSRDTPLEKQLKEATANTNWGCSTTILAEIARASFEYNSYFLIMKAVWDGLNEKPKYWRRVFKTLTLLDYLIKNGTERVIDEARDSLYRLRSLVDFHYTEEGRDKGNGVREKAKAICDLVNDSEALKAEREKARINREKFIGISSQGERTGPGYTYSTQYDAERNSGFGPRRYDPWDSKTRTAATAPAPGSSRFAAGPLPSDLTASGSTRQSELELERDRAEKERDKARKRRERHREALRIKQQKAKDAGGGRGSIHGASSSSGSTGSPRRGRGALNSKDSNDSSSDDSSAESSSSSSSESEEAPPRHKGASSRPRGSGPLIDFDMNGGAGGNRSAAKVNDDAFNTDAGWGNFTAAPAFAPPAPPVAYPMNSGASGIGEDLFGGFQSAPTAVPRPPPMSTASGGMPDFFSMTHTATTPAPMMPPRMPPQTMRPAGPPTMRPVSNNNPFASAGGPQTMGHPMPNTASYMKDLSNSLFELSLDENRTRMQMPQAGVAPRPAMNMGSMGSFGNRMGPMANHAGWYQAFSPAANR